MSSYTALILTSSSCSTRYAFRMRATYNKQSNDVTSLLLALPFRGLVIRIVAPPVQGTRFAWGLGRRKKRNPSRRRMSSPLPCPIPCSALRLSRHDKSVHGSWWVLPGGRSVCVCALAALTVALGRPGRRNKHANSSTASSAEI